jgi:hypothetical protein
VESVTERPAIVLIDNMGYAIGIIWQTPLGEWRGKKMPQFNSSLCPANLKQTKQEMINWIMDWRDKE